MTEKPASCYFIVIFHGQFPKHALVFLCSFELSAGIFFRAFSRASPKVQKYILVLVIKICVVQKKNKCCSDSDQIIVSRLTSLVPDLCF